MAFTVVGKGPVANLIDLWTDYCDRRGLTPEMLAPMKGELLSQEQLYKTDYGFGTTLYGMKSIGAIGGFLYPTGPDGEVQVRLIFDPHFVGQEVSRPGETAKPVKSGKYRNPPSQPQPLYVPPHLSDWGTTEYDLLIVEGALNAVRLAASGYHAVAIMGVNNYRIFNKHSEIIPLLVKFIQGKNAKRIIYIPDSDTGESKPQLAHAVNTFCLDMMKLRPGRQDTILICRPPQNPDGSKNGADDYLNAKGIDEFNRMLREDSVKFEDNKYLQIQKEAVTRYIYNETTDEYWDEKLRLFIKVSHLNNHLKGYGLVEDILAPKAKPIFYSNDRLRNAPSLRVAEGLKFRPDLEDSWFSEIDEVGSRYFINRHSPADVPKAVKGDITLFHKMMASLCRNSPSSIQKNLVIMAKHAQEPGLTPKYALLFTGDKGAGKSNMAECIGKALSKRYHSARVKPDVDFNDHWRGFACKEWAEFDSSMDPEWLKDLITSETYEVNGKNKSIYVDHNHTLNVFTCNDLRSKIQEGDRRFVISGYAKADDKELGLAFEEAVKSGMLPNYLRYYLLYEVDCSDYDRIDVRTEMTDEVINASKSYKSTVKDEVLEDLIDRAPPEMELVTNDLLSQEIAKYDVKLISFVKEFSRDFPPTFKTVVNVGAKSVKFRSFRNHEKWAKEGSTEEYRKQFVLIEKMLGRKY
jgi:hypothetical protein